VLCTLGSTIRLLFVVWLDGQEEQYLYAASLLAEVQMLGWWYFRVLEISQDTVIIFFTIATMSRLWKRSLC
jgi:hypothetical protein